jgi:GT2 family glycosyltransferase
MLGPRLLNPDGSEQAGDRRRVLTPWLALVEALGLYRLPGVQRFNLHREPLPQHTLAVPVISGACMLLPQPDYWALGGMDEGFFLHVEDIDFCVRFAAGGGTVYFCPGVSVAHAKGTSEASALTVEWHKTRGFFRYFRKHFSGRYPPGVVPLVNAAILGRYLLLASAHLLTRPLTWLRGRLDSGGSRCKG